MTTFRMGQLEISRDRGFRRSEGSGEIPAARSSRTRPSPPISTGSAPRFYDPSDGTVAIHIQSWLFRTAHHTILVDTCVGNHKTRHFPPFHMRENPYLDRLRAAGASPEDIDYVFCTHLHSDHVGWNTRLENGRWVPTFPNAKYLFSKTDFEVLDPRRSASESAGRR